MPREGSGLVGALELDFTADEADASVQVAPVLLCRRLARLRTGWGSEDWPNPTPEVDPLDQLSAFVDPQAIGIGDLRRARPGSPAYDLWLARHADWASRRALLEAARTAAVDPGAAVGAVIELGLSRPGAPVDVNDLTELEAAQRLGERIGARLAPLGLTPASFGFLMPVLRMAESGQPILDPEWEVVLDTVLTAGKRRDFPAWREQERAAAVTLSPEYFRLARDNEETAPEQARSLTIAPWLSTRDARRAWVEVLGARVDQEAAVRAGVDAARNSAEETALPLLRDTLVTASDAEGDDLPSRAEWLTRRLLVDLRVAGTHRTTRVAQAIEALQELLFRLRTGQLPLDDPGPLTGESSVRAVVTEDGRTHLLAHDGTGMLWHRVWDGRWRSWHQQGRLPRVGPLPVSDLAVTRRGAGFDVAVVADRVLWVRRFEVGWEPWQAVPGGPELSGGPGLAARGAAALDAFVLRIGDLQVLRRRWDGTTWSAPEDVGVPSQRNPVAISLDPGTVDLVVARSGADLFKPTHRWWDGAAWQTEDLVGRLGSEAALVSPAPDRLELYQNLSGSLNRLVRDGAWQPWGDVEAGLPPTDPQMAGAPAVCIHGPGVVDVYAVRVGRGGTALWHRRAAAGVWSAWERVPRERLELDALQFDAEWQWVGSYATWRSAVFVRLYPDNLLLPSLVPRQSPAFAELVAQTRPTRRIGPTQALQLAGAYSRYLADVSHLRVLASCRATVTLVGPSGTPFGRALDFLFGLAPSGKVYWSSFDQLAVEAGGYAQSFWTEVPVNTEDESTPAKVSAVVGALPWMDAALGQHHINLFLQLAVPTGRTLARARFDLERYGRDDFCVAGAVEVAGLPTGYGGAVESVDRMTVVPVQSDSFAEAPRLAIHVWSSATAYVRALNAGTDGFAAVTGDWAACEVVPRLVGAGGIGGSESVTGLHAALRTGGTNWLVYSHGPAIRAYPQASGAVAVDVGTTPDRVIGALAGGSSSVFVFTDMDGATTYQRLTRSGATVTPGTIFLAPGVTGLARHSGSFSPSLFVTPGASGHSYAYLCRVEGDRLAGSTKYDVVPVLDPATSVLPNGTVTELQNRRVAIKGVYDRNAATPESVLSYLREAYRLVPQQIGLALQSSGEFVAALDWFATVYDYRAPRPNRYIDHGLALDATLPAAAVVKQPEGWLLDPLNPHAIARTRRAATARYAIATVIGCLNAYADAEFGVDTSESLVRARLLYDSALGLCDVPELRQSLPNCGALIGALEIQPGFEVPPEVAAALGAIREELTQGEAFPAPGTVFEMEKHVKLVELAKAGLVTWETVIPALLRFKDTVLAAASPPPTTTEVLAGAAQMRATGHAALLVDPAVEKAVRLAGLLGSGAALPVELADIGGAR